MSFRRSILALICVGLTTAGAFATPPAPAGGGSTAPVSGAKGASTDPLDTSGGAPTSAPDHRSPGPSKTHPKGRIVTTSTPGYYFTPDQCTDAYSFQSNPYFYAEVRGKKASATGKVEAGGHTEEVSDRREGDPGVSTNLFALWPVSTTASADLQFSAPETEDAGRKTREERESSRNRISASARKKADEFPQGLDMAGQFRFDACSRELCAAHPHEVEIEIHVKVAGDASLSGKDAASKFAGNLATKYEKKTGKFTDNQGFSFDRNGAKKDAFLFEDGKLLKTVKATILPGETISTYELQILPDVKGGDHSSASMTLKVIVEQKLKNWHCPVCGNHAP